MQRDLYDLGHPVFTLGVMGRLQTCMCLPVLPGDSIEIDYQTVVRLSPLRRNMVIDAMVDLFCFYVPHRHIYGQDWVDFINQGQDETITFPTANSGADSIGYLGSPSLIGEQPLWINGAYNRIWNRFFRVPSDDASIVADTDFDSTGRQYGRLCARPKRIWSTGIDDEITAADREVTVVAGQLDLTELEAVQGRYKSELVRMWYGQYYNDLIREGWGGRAKTDADERPTLIMRQTKYLSGYDIDGTGDASLGQYAGKSANVCGIRVPRRFIPEHGTVWVMMLVRFPTIHEQETHFLFQKPQPTYEEISGDADIWSRKAPIEHEIQDFFLDTSSTTKLGVVPYGQWYREHPPLVHRDYRQLDGFSFLRTTPTTKNQARYCQIAEYDWAFQTIQAGHWQANGQMAVNAYRSLATPDQSIFAGTR